MWLLLANTFALEIYWSQNFADDNGDHEYLDIFVDPEYDRAIVSITITIMIAYI